MVANNTIIKEKITYIIDRYSSVINSKTSFLSLRHSLWYDPNKPGYGWGIKDRIYNFVPDSIRVNKYSSGFYMDSTLPYTNNRWTTFYRTRLFIDRLYSLDTVIINAWCYVSKDFNGKDVWIAVRNAKYNNQHYNLQKKGTWQKLNVTIIGQNETCDVFFFFSKKGNNGFDNLNGYVILYYPVIVVNKQEIGKREYVALNTRKIRWNKAVKLFHQYTLKEKLIGKGFFYQYYIKGNNTDNKHIVDYPHSPILSAFLYSGILGGIFYLIYLLLGLYYYISNFQNLKYFFIIYLITISFAMMSGNSHFSIPIFNLFSLIPFLYKSNNYE